MSEKEQAKRLGATQQKNSGRGKVKKGDMVKGHFMIDVKEYSKSFSVSHKVWAKTTSDAWKAGNREPAINLVLDSEEGTVRLMIFDEIMGKEMMEMWNERYG